ncbi:MAG: hypothetical protein P8Y85_08765 [Nitrospirota bacterium]|jgi:hypothetical protein
MKRILIVFMVVALTLVVTHEMAAAQMGPGMMEQGQGYGGGQQQGQQQGHGWGYNCPGPGAMHGYGMGPGMMGGWGGYGMGPGMGGYGMGPGMMGGWGGYGMGPGYGPMNQKFLDETKDMRRELNTKMFDYMEEIRKPQPDQKKLDSLRGDIWNLNKQIYEKYSQ